MSPLPSSILLLGAQASDAQASGEIVGRLLFFVIVIGGAIRCFQIAREEHANGLAVGSLGVALGAWTMAGLIQLLPDDAPWAGLATILIAMVSSVTFVIAAVLAVIGLVQMRRTPGVWTRGRGQGWTAVIILMWPM